jgi:hypothetical protein
MPSAIDVATQAMRRRHTGVNVIGSLWAEWSGVDGGCDACSNVPSSIHGVYGQVICRVRGWCGVSVRVSVSVSVRCDTCSSKLFLRKEEMLTVIGKVVLALTSRPHSTCLERTRRLGRRVPSQ